MNEKKSSCSVDETNRLRHWERKKSLTPKQEWKLSFFSTAELLVGVFRLFPAKLEGFHEKEIQQRRQSDLDLFIQTVESIHSFEDLFYKVKSFTQVDSTRGVKKNSSP